ncbi:ATP-dependent helicase [Desulfofalx alkaliphila]|uniref:ATP-dependent helicase n=1 Tax=Desulfofalx alkaliphila TaxID=105483 RepID=UPI00068FFE7E|nr:ATP-dependent helicase [Desulfofalx alkaliphila]
MINLRPGQREVAAYRGGKMAVPAVPGAGKTTVLAYLAADLIEKQATGGGKILIVTVMNSAVANFRSRIGDFLEDRGLPRSKGYDVKTLHSLAMTILKEKPEFLLINQNFQIIDEGSQQKLLAQLTQDWMSNNRKLWMEPINIPSHDKWYHRALESWEQRDLPAIIKDAVSFIKAAGLNTEQIKEMRARLDDSSYLAWALDIYRQYTRELNKNGLLDFDDLIVQALRLLKEEAQVLERLQKRWTLFFEDEAQDSSPLQEEILLLLSAHSGNLVRVGDSNQAILGTFTAAEPEIFRNYCARPDVVKQEILYSSRSTTQIINLANGLVDWVNESHPQKECRSALEPQHIRPVDDRDRFPNPKTNGYTIHIKGFSNQEQETERVARLAAEHVRQNPENTVAVLVPTRRMQEKYAEQFHLLNAPFEEVGQITNKQKKTVADVKEVLTYLAKPHHTGNLIRVMKNIFVSDLNDDAQVILGGLFEKYSPEQVLYPVGEALPWLEMPEEFSDPEVYGRFVQGINKLQQWLDASVKMPPDELVLFLAEDMNLELEQLGIAHNLALLIRQKLHQYPHWHLVDIAQELPAMESSVRTYLKAVNDQQGFEPSPGVISLITTHKSKGLEWDTVYLTGVTAGEYPSTVKDKFRSDMWYLKEDKNSPMARIKAELKAHTGKTATNPIRQFKIDEISERLRLLYVAITRVKKNLLLTYYDNYFRKKIGPSEALIALRNIMARERAANDKT